MTSVHGIKDSLKNGFNRIKTNAGKAYKNICQRINGEEVPFMDLDARKGMLGVIKGLFGMN